MNIPSVQFLYKNAKDSLFRFPLTLFCSLLGVCIGIFLIEKEGNVKNIFPYINLLLTAGIGIPLYFCAAVISSKKKFSGKENIVLYAMSTIILVLIFLSLPTAESTHNTSLPYIKYTIYNIIIHLLVSFVPFIFERHINGFWNYNKILFTRLWTAAFYSGILFAGLALALLSMKLLFEIDFNEKLYAEIFVVIAGLFNTWFFVSGIPVEFEQLEDEVIYPKGLKIFAQYILLPLLALYLVILYFYGGKILLLWDWPKGIVSYLIICVSVLGILTFLLLYPYGKQEEQSWINKFSKSFYVILLPLLAILFIAILMRMDDYGITVNRYVVLFLGIWLTTVCLSTIIGRSSIKFIPTSLALMLILISFGPWGMFSVSERAQVNRLKNILEQAKIMKQSKIVNESIWTKDTLGNYVASSTQNEKLLNDSLHNEVKSILDYLDDHHGFSSIRGWFNQNVDSIVNYQSAKEHSRYINEALYYMKSMGLDYETRYKNIEKQSTYFYSDADETLTKVTDYDYVIPFDRYLLDNETVICDFEIDSVTYKLVINKKASNELKFFADKTEVSCHLQELESSLLSSYNGSNNNNIPLSKMELMGSTSNIDYKIGFHSEEILDLS
jgi:hypothetical protein